MAIPWRESGHEVISVDIDPRFTPEICEDTLQLSYCKLDISNDTIRSLQTSLLHETTVLASSKSDIGTSI